MRTALIALAFLSAAPAFAADSPAIHRGDMVRDANNLRLGAVNRVNADGSVGIIFDSRFIVIPAETLSVVDGKAMTKLTKREVSGLN